jgi:hypothetical protein
LSHVPLCNLAPPLLEKRTTSHEHTHEAKYQFWPGFQKFAGICNGFHQNYFSSGQIFKSFPKTETVFTKTVSILARFSKVFRKLKQFSPKPFQFWPGFQKFSEN